MRRSIPLLAVILALQLGLAALLAVRKDPLAATTPSTPLIGSALQNADDVVIEGKPSGGSPQNSNVELAKRNGQWILPRYFNAPVDRFKLSAVLSELAGLRRGLPIATSTSALRRFEVEDGHFERRIILSRDSKVLDTVYFGSSAGPRTSDARTARDHAVYAVSLATYELPTQNSDWFDGDLVQSDPGNLTELEVSAGRQAALKLQRQSQPAAGASASAAATTAATHTATPGAQQPLWVDPTLTGGRRIDSAHAETLVREVTELHLDGVLGLSAQPDWQQDDPLLTLVLHDSRHPDKPVTWTLSKPKSADYYVLKDSAQPWYFQVSSFAGKQLVDAGAPTQLLARTVRAPSGAASAQCSNAHAFPRTCTRSLSSETSLPITHARR